MRLASIKLLSGEEIPDRILWRSWKDGRGLIAVEDKETSDAVCKLIGQIQIQKTSFRAWHRGEFGEGRLVTCHLEGNVWKDYTKDTLMDLLLKQNKLPGRYTGAIITATDCGRLLKFFADKDLWEELLARRQSSSHSRLLLKLAWNQIRLQLSKANQEATPGADAAGASAGESAAVRTAPNLGAIQKLASVDDPKDNPAANNSTSA